MATETRTQEAAAAAFHDKLHASHIHGLWELTSQMTSNPRPEMAAHIWPWSLVEPLIRESGDVVPVGEDRRALQLFNPGLGGRWATTNTLIGAVQLLLPGEVARAHRHTPTAIRFIMKGQGAYTNVDGERIDMAPGDLILTPSWAWHDHGNDGSEAVTWLDGLDIPLVKSLESIFFELYPDRQVPASRPANLSTKLYGAARLSPSWVKERPLASPLLLYAWRDVRPALDAMRDLDGDAHDGIVLEYSHPQTGGSVLPTMGCRVQLIRSGEHLKAHRHTGSAVVYVVEGSGFSIIEGRRFDWTAGDIIAMPSWAMHEHANQGSADAVLFSFDDLPLIQAAGLYREEHLESNGGQQGH